MSEISRMPADGDRAVREYTVKFDGTAPENRNNKEQMSAALKVCRADFIEPPRAAQNIRIFIRGREAAWLIR